MLLHLNICIEWLVSNSKEDSKFHLENVLKNWKRKKERDFLSSSVLAQLSRAQEVTPLRPASHRARTVSFFPLRFPLWAERREPSKPLAQLTSASVPSFLCCR
jgi:hypothetical protein